MKAAPKICFDKILPQNLRHQHRAMAMPDGRMRAISLIGKQWANGSTIQIRFMEGTHEQKDLVKEFAPEWTKHANLNFEFTNDPHAEIRVSFDTNDGAWSYVGIDNVSIPLHAATLNLGWVDKGVILHEFGHMIGLSHEHQNPDGGIEWDEDAVIRDLSGAPNFWDEETIRHNVLNKYSADQLHGTVFDPASIMVYAFPDSWTKNMGAIPENNDLSEIDRNFIKSEKMYPGRSSGTSVDDKAIALSISKGVKAEISQAGEEDIYRIDVKEEGLHVIETTGSTDVILILFGPDSFTKLVAMDDDSGTGTNARISATLQPGKYYAAVRHYNLQQTGDYRITVTSY